VVAASDLGLPLLTITFEYSDEDALCFPLHFRHTFHASGKGMHDVADTP
jgi:hypothetical protein